MTLAEQLNKLFEQDTTANPFTRFQFGNNLVKGTRVEVITGKHRGMTGVVFATGPSLSLVVLDGSGLTVEIQNIWLNII